MIPAPEGPDISFMGIALTCIHSLRHLNKHKTSSPKSLIYGSYCQIFLPSIQGCNLALVYLTKCHPPLTNIALSWGPNGITVIHSRGYLVEGEQSLEGNESGGIHILDVSPAGGHGQVMNISGKFQFPRLYS